MLELLKGGHAFDSLNQVVREVDANQVDTVLDSLDLVNQIILKENHSQLSAVRNTCNLAQSV